MKKVILGAPTENGWGCWTDHPQYYACKGFHFTKPEISVESLDNIIKKYSDGHIYDTLSKAAFNCWCGERKSWDDLVYNHIMVIHNVVHDKEDAIRVQLFHANHVHDDSDFQGFFFRHINGEREKLDKALAGNSQAFKDSRPWDSMDRLYRNNAADTRVSLHSAMKWLNENPDKAEELEAIPKKRQRWVCRTISEREAGVEKYTDSLDFSE